MRPANNKDNSGHLAVDADAISRSFTRLLEDCKKPLQVILMTLRVDREHRKGIQKASGIFAQVLGMGLVYSLRRRQPPGMSGAGLGLRLDGVPSHPWTHDEKWQRIELWQDLCAASKRCICQDSSEFHADIADPDRADRNRFAAVKEGDGVFCDGGEVAVLIEWADSRYCGKSTNKWGTINTETEVP